MSHRPPPKTRVREPSDLAAVAAADAAAVLDDDDVHPAATLLPNPPQPALEPPESSPPRRRYRTPQVPHVQSTGAPPTVFVRVGTATKTSALRTNHTTDPTHAGQDRRAFEPPPAKGPAVAAAGPPPPPPRPSHQQAVPPASPGVVPPPPSPPLPVAASDAPTTTTWCNGGIVACSLPPPATYRSAVVACTPPLSPTLADPVPYVAPPILVPAGPIDVIRAHVRDFEERVGLPPRTVRVKTYLFDSARRAFSVAYETPLDATEPFEHSPALQAHLEAALGKPPRSLEMYHLNKYSYTVLQARQRQQQKQAQQEQQLQAQKAAQQQPVPRAVASLLLAYMEHCVQRGYISSVGSAAADAGPTSEVA